MAYDVNIGKKKITFPQAAQGVFSYTMPETELGKSIRSAISASSDLGVWMQLLEKEAERAEQIKNDRYLSDIGRREKLKDFGVDLESEIQKHMRNLSDRCKDVLKALDLALLGVKPLPKGDVVGFLADQEIRAFVRSMSKEERAELMGQIRTGGHQQIYNAVMRAIPALSGITEQQAEKIRLTGIVRENTYELDLLRHFVEAIQKDTRAASKAHDELHRLMGLQVDGNNGHGFRSRAFDELKGLSTLLEQTAVQSGLLPDKEL